MPLWLHEGPAAGSSTLLPKVRVRVRVIQPPTEPIDNRVKQDRHLNIKQIQIIETCKIQSIKASVT